MSAHAPLSHARHRRWWVLVCLLALLVTGHGRLLAAVPSDLAPGLSSLCSAAGEGGAGLAHAVAHADGCCGQGPAWAPVPVGSPLPAGWSQAALRPLPALAPHRPAPAWSSAQSRAPPRA